MKLLGYPFTDLPLDALGRHVRAGMSGARMAIYCPLNAALISGAAGDPAKKAIVDAADVVILDSRFVGRLARLIGLATPHVVAGSDLTVHLLDQVLTREDRVCFVVAGPEVVAALKARYDLPHAVYVTPKYGLARTRPRSSVSAARSRRAVRRSPSSASAFPSRRCWRRRCARRAVAASGYAPAPRSSSRPASSSVRRSGCGRRASSGCIAS